MVERKLEAESLYWAWWGWEPLDHYRRLSGNAGAVDGRAPSLREWYDRLHSKELVKLMADIGINLAVTHFFKGFGLKHEHDEQMRTKALVQLAHEHGIRVLGYCQSRSLYYETFLLEEPEATDWIQRDQLGQPRTWGGAYYRWAPCIMNRDFRSYMKRVIRFGLEEIGLDGIHFDNCYAQPCYCETCQQAFRKWLSERYPSPRERFGLASFDAVRLPPERRSPGSINDPLIQAWVRFRCEALGEYLDDLSDYARSLRPDVIVLGNPAYPRNPHATHDISVWAPLVGKALDLMFAENGQFPGMDEEALISQVRAYKHAAAIGYRVISTTWQRGRENRLGLPETASQIKLQVAEAAANGGIPGTNWALRPMGEGDRMRIDRAEWRQALKEYLLFVQANRDSMRGAQRVKDVAVLYSFASEAFDTRRATAIRLATEEALLRGGLTWEALFTDDMSELDDFSVLVLAGQSHLSDCECAAIRAFVEKGKKLILIGENGYRDETGLERGVDPFGNLPDGAVTRLPAQVADSEITVDYTARIALSKDWRVIVDAVARAASDGLTVRLFGSTKVTVNAYEFPSGDLAVHLVNYRTPRKTEGLRLQVKRGTTARIVTPEGAETVLQVRSDGDKRFIDVPGFAVYALITVS